jgi:hypothetical protein
MGRHTDVQTIRINGFLCKNSPDRLQYRTNEGVESEFDLENIDKTMNCLQVETFRCDEHNMSEEKPNSEYDIVNLHYVNKQNLGSCPQVQFLIGAQQYSAVLDIECEALILSKQLYKKLKSNRVDSLELPTLNFVLVAAFSWKAQRVKRPAFLTVKFGDTFIDQIFLVSEELLTPVLTGYDFCFANGTIPDFQRGKIVSQNDGESRDRNYEQARRSDRSGGITERLLNTHTTDRRLSDGNDKTTEPFVLSQFF